MAIRKKPIIQSIANPISSCHIIILVSFDRRLIVEILLEETGSVTLYHNDTPNSPRVI
jgi:hypothetical protein